MFSLPYACSGSSEPLYALFLCLGLFSWRRKIPEFDPLANILVANGFVTESRSNLTGFGKVGIVLDVFLRGAVPLTRPEVLHNSAPFEMFLHN